MSSLRLNLRGHLDTVLLRSVGRHFWCPRIAATDRRFHVLTAAEVQRRSQGTVKPIGLEDYWVALALRCPHEV
jgi:hypothetical protein